MDNLNDVSILDLAISLRNIFRSNEYKHTPLITVHKTVVYPIIEAIMSKANTLASTKDCDTCALRRMAREEAVVSDVVYRVAHYSNNPHVTEDEADALERFFTEKAVFRMYNEDEE